MQLSVRFLHRCCSLTVGRNSHHRLRRLYTRTFGFLSRGVSSGSRLSAHRAGLQTSRVQRPAYSASLQQRNPVE